MDDSIKSSNYFLELVAAGASEAMIFFSYFFILSAGILVLSPLILFG